MKKLINTISGTAAAAIICTVLSIASIVLAFFGSDKSIQLMSTPLPLIFSALIFILLAVRAFITLLNRRFDSALLHAGCALVLGGWLWGHLEPGITENPKPLQGSMALVDGDVMNALWDGPVLTNLVGKLDFTIKLEKFMIDYYERAPGDRSHGRMPPIREYRSRVTVTYPDKAPYVENIRVNHPVRIGDYLVYQMSWGETVNYNNQPVTYTVLRFIREPGLHCVYAGFIVLFSGILLFCYRIFRLKIPEMEVKDVD
ncbi:MAG: cytochrome c biogenesis protein ResB [Kiritimatiellia bacterium]